MRGLLEVLPLICKMEFVGTNDVQIGIAFLPSKQPRKSWYSHNFYMLLVGDQRNRLIFILSISSLFNGFQSIDLLRKIQQSIVPK